MPASEYLICESNFSFDTIISMSNVIAPDETLLPQLFANGRKLHYKKKELIYRQGDVPSGVYYICEGLVKVYTLDSKANENIVYTIGPGDTFLLTWALSDVADDVCIAAMTHVEVLRMSRHDFLAGCQARHDLTLRLLHEMASHYKMAFEHIANLDYRNAQQRVMYCLLRLARRYGLPKSGGLLALDKIYTAHTTLASSTNLARETVTRELNRLENTGLIRRLKKEIIVTNVNKLAAAVGVDWHYLS
jgi:CRP/FNR family cyclic AMP-dependent transcriptional regulator